MWTSEPARTKSPPSQWQHKHLYNLIGLWGLAAAARAAMATGASPEWQFPLQQSLGATGLSCRTPWIQEMGQYHSLDTMLLDNILWLKNWEIKRKKRAPMRPSFCEMFTDQETKMLAFFSLKNISVYWGRMVENRGLATSKELMSLLSAHRPEATVRLNRASECSF